MTSSSTLKTMPFIVFPCVDAGAFGRRLIQRPVSAITPRQPALTGPTEAGLRLAVSGNQAPTVPIARGARPRLRASHRFGIPRDGGRPHGPGRPPDGCSSEPSGLVVLHGLHDLLGRVHHE